MAGLHAKHCNLMESPMNSIHRLVCVWLSLISAVPGLAKEPKRAPSANADDIASNYFPPPESQGGWRSLLPENGDPDADGKAQIRKTAGIDWDKLAEAWKYNASGEGATG